MKSSFSTLQWCTLFQISHATSILFYHTYMLPFLNITYTWLPCAWNSQCLECRSTWLHKFAQVQRRVLFQNLLHLLFLKDVKCRSDLSYLLWTINPMLVNFTSKGLFLLVVPMFGRTTDDYKIVLPSNSSKPSHKCNGALLHMSQTCS